MLLALIVVAWDVCVGSGKPSPTGNEHSSLCLGYCGCQLVVRRFVLLAQGKEDQLETAMNGAECLADKVVLNTAMLLFIIHISGWSWPCFYMGRVIVPQRCPNLLVHFSSCIEKNKAAGVSHEQRRPVVC